MKALRRVLVAVLGLLNLAVAVLFASCLIKHSFGERFVDFMDRCFVYNMSRWFVDGVSLWKPILLILLFLVLGLAILYAAVQYRREEKAVRVDSGDGNSILISREAIDSVVKQAVSEITGVQSASNNMTIRRGRLLIDLNLVVPTSQSITEVGNAARQLVAERLQAILCVTPKNINVQVTNVIEQARPVEMPMELTEGTNDGFGS